MINGQSHVDVVFLDELETADWRLVSCTVLNDTDASALSIVATTITQRGTLGFTIQLSGSPDSGNYQLLWGIAGAEIASGDATAYALSGPSSEVVGIPSADFTVHIQAGKILPAPVTITPNDGSGPGVHFTPSSVVLTTDTPSATFKHTAPAAMSYNISTTNDGGLTDPPALVVNAKVNATTYTLSGPASGSVGVESTPFTVALLANQAVPSPVTITPHAISGGGGGGTFTPSSVILSTTSPSATFTFTPTTSGAISIETTNAGGLTDLTDPAPINYAASAALHLLNTLISYWKMDEPSGTGNRMDSKGTNHLTPNAYQSALAGIINNAPVFVGASLDYMTCPSNTSLQMGSTSFTISLWVKLNSLPLSASLFALFAKMNETPNAFDYEVDIVNSGVGPHFSGFTQSAGTGYTADANTPIVTTGVWYHIVWWFDATNGQVHIRVNDTTTYSSPAGAGATDVSSAPLDVGARAYSGSPQYTDGMIDEIGLWKRVLTTDEKTALYNGGAGLPYGSFTP